MKYFIAITLIAAVASAAAVRPLRSEIAEIQEIIAAIQSPSTDPATAAALEEMLLDILGIKPEPVEVGPAIIGGAEGIAVGPAIIDPLEGISVGPAIIPFPLPDGGAVAEEPIVPGPAIVAPAPVAADSSPLVQIIVNINQAAVESSPIAVGPAAESAPEAGHVDRPEPIGRPEPVGVIPVEPVQVVETAPEPVPSPISPPIAINPIGVVAPQPAEPIQIGVPVIPEAAVVLPEELN